MSHIWYMLMVLGMHVLFPFVANALHSMEWKTLKVPVLFPFICAFVYPFLTLVFSIFGIEIGYLQLSLGFSGGAYGLYFILGFVIRNGGLQKVRTSMLIICASACFGF